MIDVHSHIMNNIDDGCSSIEESIKTINELKKLGFCKIILTPHYIKGSVYHANNEIKKDKYNSLKKVLKKENIDIELYLANEIYISYDIVDLLMNEEVYPINDTIYLLIELPLYNEVKGVQDYLYELRLKGYIPIIAHPERYSYFQKDYKKMVELYESGVLFQANYGSIIGIYGKEAKKLIKYALKNNMISFMGTDIHSPKFSLIDDFEKATRKIKKIIGEKKYQEITFSNAFEMIENKEIECLD